jgi:hypothetical protein
LACPPTLPRQQVVSLSETDGGGAKSFDGEKAWSSIKNSILSAVHHSTVGHAGQTISEKFFGLICKNAYLQWIENDDTNKKKRFAIHI